MNSDQNNPPKTPAQEREERVLKYWNEHKIFEKSVDREAPRGNFVFYDGPPFATGLPHFGHVLPTSIKDAVPRYKTMRGYRVRRRWGWDCHGLPVENLIEKELGLKSKKDIVNYGIKNFNDAARSAVHRYVNDWKEIIPRLGRWADMENDYETMNASYTESVWWAFKKLHDKGLVYEGFKPMQICPHCETTLSNFEVAQGYKDIKDISVFVKFETQNTKHETKFQDPNSKIQINSKSENQNSKTYFLAWTTTPWTLPGNVALAVGKDVEYVKVRIKSKEQKANSKDEEEDKEQKEKIENEELGRRASAGNTTPAETQGERRLFRHERSDMRKSASVAVPRRGSEGVELFILAKERLAATFKKEEYEIVAEMKGSDLVGKSYEPLFDYYSKDSILKNRQNGWKIYAADFVTTTDGTGIVHIAPAFGADDYALGQKDNLPFVQHVNIDGTFKHEIKDFAGLQVKPKDTTEDKDAHLRTDIKVIQWLQDKNLLFAKENLTHSYPHCWRCDTPLLNYAASSWFVRVSDITNKLVAQNKKINWIPQEVGEGRFGNWLLGAKDWAISRSRFWGAPIPVWRVVESRKSIKSKVEEKIEIENRNREGEAADTSFGRRASAGDITPAETQGERDANASVVVSEADHDNLIVIGSITEMKKYSKAKNIYYVMRHGEAENNTLNVISSRADDPKHLTEKGREQVKKAAKYFVGKNIDLILTSPFIRTRETTDIIVNALNFPKKNIIIDDRLRELDAGIYHGRPFNEFVAAFPYEKRFSMRLPEGENYADVRKRVGEFIYDMEKKYSGKNILIVTHDVSAFILESIALGLDNTSIINRRDSNKLHYVDNAVPIKLDFAPLPHNDDYEIDLHRPYIDEIKLCLPSGEKLMRVEEVFDCWFESGSMPYAEAHYPFQVESIKYKVGSEEEARTRNVSSAATQDERRLFRHERSDMRKSTSAVVGGAVQDSRADFGEREELIFNPKQGFLSKLTGGILGKSSGYPADFIAEGLDQTRGWFYSMLVLGTALFDRAPYKNAVVNGIVLSEDGSKMSKSKSNFPDLLPVVNKYGADALRYYLLSSPLVRAQEFCFSEKGVDEVVKKHIGRLLNVVSFYELYVKSSAPDTKTFSSPAELASEIRNSPRAGHSSRTPSAQAISSRSNSPRAVESFVSSTDHSLNILDCWIISRLNELNKEVTEAMEKYELDKATRPFADFIDDLSTWYLRRSRDRFKGDDESDKTAALATTRFVLLELSKLLAPFMPFVAEDIYLKLNGGAESVHLEKWPIAEKIDTKLLENMKVVRKIASLGLEARSKAKINVRQPLGKLKVTCNHVIPAKAGIQSQTSDSKINTLDSCFRRNDKQSASLLELIKEEVNVKEIIFDEKISSEVELDTVITPELKEEGELRDLIRAIQDKRKAEGLTIHDRPILKIFVEDKAKRVFLEKNKEQLIKAVLLKGIELVSVIPAKAGIQSQTSDSNGNILDSRMRGNDKRSIVQEGYEFELVL